MLNLTSLCGPWLMDRQRLEMLPSLLHAHAWPTPQQMEEARQASAQKAVRRSGGNVAVIPVSGMIEQKMSAMGWMFGGTSTEAIHAALDQCMASRDVGTVVLDIDSPGGTSYGVQELAQHVRDCCDKKAVHAIANSLCASAAYWIGSAASSLSAAPGSDLGSIGVYSLHLDMSGALEQQGVKATIIKAGKYKAEGNPFEPLDKDSRDHLQESVDDTYTEFVQGVAKYRGVTPADVRANYGEGRTLSAKKAVAAGMADRVITLKDLLGRLTSGQVLSAGQGRMASAEVLRLRHAREKSRTA